jgi:hypothetical protein
MLLLISLVLSLKSPTIEGGGSLRSALGKSISHKLLQHSHLEDNRSEKRVEIVFPQDNPYIANHLSQYRACQEPLLLYNSQDSTTI